MLSNLNNFHSLEVVDRVSETQLQVGENSKLNNLAVKGLTDYRDHPVAGYAPSDIVVRQIDTQLLRFH